MFSTFIAHAMIRPLPALLSILLSLSLLAGCAPLVIGGAATTAAVVATDRRTAGEQLDDQTIEMRVASEMETAFGNRARVLGTAYAGRLLLVGDVPSAEDRQRAETIARAIPKVVQIDNHIRVGELTPFSVRSNDTWLTSKVKSQMIATKDVPFRTMKVTTERGVVYLLGKVSQAEADRAAYVASSITGVNKVVKLFHVVSPESILAPSQNTATAGESGTVDTSPPDSTDGVEAMPVN